MSLVLRRDASPSCEYLGTWYMSDSRHHALLSVDQSPTLNFATGK